MELLNRNRLVIVSPRRTPPKASGGPARRGFYTFRSFCKDGGGGGEDEDEEKDDDREDKEICGDKTRGRRGKTGRRRRSRGPGKGGAGGKRN